MGIIRAAVDTARGTLADQWLDVVEAGEMGEQTLFTEGRHRKTGLQPERKQRCDLQRFCHSCL